MSLKTTARRVSSNKSTKAWPSAYASEISGKTYLVCSKLGVSTIRRTTSIVRGWSSGTSAMLWLSSTSSFQNAISWSVEASTALAGTSARDCKGRHALRIRIKARVILYKGFARSNMGSSHQWGPLAPCKLRSMPACHDFDINESGDPHSCP